MEKMDVACNANSNFHMYQMHPGMPMIDSISEYEYIYIAH